MRFALLTLAGLPLLCTAVPQKRAANPTVTIASGVVVGTATAVSHSPTPTGLVNAYLGVPFAQSPPLRFAPPTAPKAWAKPLIAQKNPPACLQQFYSGTIGQREQAYFNNPGLPPPAESEDCMYLNVFAPTTANSTNLKSVLFWIYGGNLEFGTASLAYYNGSSLAADHDVVVVAINYRTNMFGFSNSPEIPYGQQNSGFLDQRFALQWVQDNIKKFGGDPTKVTIFGESAGGFSVKQLLANPPTPLPFRAAIMESQQLAPIANGNVSYNQVVSHFGCSNAASPLACLRKLSATDIESYISDNGIGFFPVVGDGTNDGPNTLPKIQSGKFANVPVFMGTNLNESTVFLELAGADGNLTTVTQQLASMGLDISPITNTVVGLYINQGITDSRMIANRIVTDLLFTCTTSTLSTAISNAGRQPVWRYQYDADFKNVGLFPNAGAYHSVEIPSVFGTYPLDNQLGKLTQTQVDLSAYMQGAWASFAKNPAAGPGWPKLGSNAGIELGTLGGTDVPAGEHTDPLMKADYACVLYDPILIAAGQAY